MLDIFKSNKPRVFLGELAVVPRTDLKQILEKSTWFGDADMDIELRNCLREIFSLPPVQTNDSPFTNDLVLDVFITKFQSGGLWAFSFGDTTFPFLWRPKITVVSRLYYLKDRKVKANFKVTEKMKWQSFVGRIFSFKPMLEQKDIEVLLYLACQKLLLKIQKGI